MNDIIIGNICSLCAMITDSISGTRRKHSEIMGIQIISQFFYAAGYTVLKGYSGVAQNIVAVLRTGRDEECKEQGIETRPQWEVDSMLQEWGKRK